MYSHNCCICMVFLLSECSNVSSSSVHDEMQSHIDRICMIYPQGGFSNASSNTLQIHCRCIITLVWLHVWPFNLSSTVVFLQTLLEEVFIVVTICLLPHFFLKRYVHKTKIAFTFLKHKGHCYLGISTVVTWVLDELERNPKKGKSSIFNFQDDGHLSSGPDIHV